MESHASETPAQAAGRLDNAQDQLEARLKIDKYALDEEIVDQTPYMNEIGQRHADALSYRDEAKAYLEGMRSRANQEIRAQAAESGEKLTVDGCEARVLADPRVQRAAEVLGAWNDRVNRWRVLWESVCARTDMLKTLGHMHTSGYWADQGLSGERRAVRSAVAKEVGKAVVEQNRTNRTKRTKLDESNPS